MIYICTYLYWYMIWLVEPDLVAPMGPVSATAGKHQRTRAFAAAWHNVEFMGDSWGHDETTSYGMIMIMNG